MPVFDANGGNSLGFETEVTMYCILPVNVHFQLQTHLDRIGPQVNLTKQLLPNLISNYGITFGKIAF